MSCPQLGLLFIMIYYDYIMMFILFFVTFAADGKDGNGLKLEKVGLTFSSLMPSQQKIPRNLLPFFKTFH